MTAANRWRLHSRRKSRLNSFRLKCEALEDRRLLVAGPRIIASSIQPDEVIATGNVDLRIQFDAAVSTAGLDSADVRLTSERFGDRDFATLDYDVDTETLTVSYLQLGEDDYTLTLSSTAIRDLDGNELDGEIEGFIDAGVSGDGDAGGDFQLNFNTDIVTQAFPTPLAPVLPLGSLVYEGVTSAELSDGGDEDRFTIDVDAPRNITIIARSTTVSSLAVSLYQDELTLLETASPLADGMSTVLSSATLPSAGEYTIAVGSNDGSGRFDLQIILNAAAELESFGGPRNDSSVSAQDLETAFVNLGDTNVQHAAVLGIAENSLLDLSPTWISAGSVWNYLDDGSDQGTDWRDPDFDDSTWESGAAELGYGDGDETTVVDFVTTPAGKNITTYFRQAFHLEDNPARFSEAVLRLKRDDGAAVYLNGIEILRDNLAPNATYNEGATSAASGADESKFHEFLVPLPPDALRSGENTVAVEVHQVSAENADMSFDLEVELFATVPGNTNLDAPTFVASGSVWSYLDDGSDQGTEWREPEFDDSGWSSGSAILGYGNENVSTAVDFGPNAAEKHITTYFRHRFEVSDPSPIEDLFLDLLRDDGAAVYLNGFEIARDNLLTNAAFDDRAIADADDPDVRALIDLPSLPEGVLRQGENVLAVEIHQSTPDSPDMFFDLSLQGFSSESERRDWYRFSLQDGESATIGLEQLTDGEVRVDLYDAEGATRLATGYSADNVDQLIGGFKDLTTDGEQTDYLLQVDGDGSQYNLFVTRNTEFDAEPNRGFRDAQPSTGALGGLTASGPGDATVLMDFAGIDDPNSFCDCEPPDPHVAVGPEHVVQVVNTAIAIYNKDGSVAVESQDLGVFLSADVINGEGFLFDPVITYDDLAERFVLAIAIGAEAAATETDILFAVSDTSDPTGAWTEQQRIDFGETDPGLFADFPRLGWNADAYVIGLNMFGSAEFVGVNVLSIQKSTALDANPSTTSHFINQHSGNGFTLVPAIMHDALPGDPMWLVETEDPLGGDAIRVVRMTNVLSSTPNFTDFEVAVSPYSTPLKSPFGLGSFNVNDIRMLSAEWRSDRLVATHTVGEETSVRWYEFETSDVTPTLVQEATVDPGPGIYTFYPSIAINAAGDIGVTYLESSNRQFVEMYVTGHVAGTPLGTFVPPLLAKASTTTSTGLRGGDYSGISVDPVTDTFWVANEVVLEQAGNPLWSTWIAEFTVADNLDDDWYAFHVDAESQLVVSATAPGSEAGEPTNALDLAIELYDPDGDLITRGTATVDPAVQLVHDAAISGDYRVRVSSENDSTGVYYLDVDGAVDDNAAPRVDEVIPIDGLRVDSFPISVTLEMSEAILLDSISYEDVLIGGQTALSMSVLDGRTFEFLIDPSVNVGDGEYTVELADDVVLDLSGMGNVAHLSSFILDQTGPRIIGTLWNGKPYPPGGVIEPGPLTVTAEFDEPLFTLSSPRKGLRTPGTDDVKFTNVVTGEEIFPLSMEFDPDSNTVSAHFAGIGSGGYELRFLSGSGAFEDIVGNALDGEPMDGSLDGTPSGDGIPGGDWFADITVDLSPQSLGDFVRLDPLGGHAARQNVTGNLGPRNLNRYELFVEAGEIVTAIVTPSNPDVLLYLNDEPSPAAGEAATHLLQAESSGIVSLDVTGSADTDYELEVFLNTGVESVARTPDDMTLPLDDFLLPIGSGVASVMGNLRPTPADLTVFATDFSDGLGDVVIDNDFGRGGGLWHLSTGRSQDGDPNHSTPNSLYYGQGENETGGGTTFADAPHSGAVVLPSMDLPMSERITLSFSYFAGRGGQLSRDDIAEVSVDDGSGFVTLLTTADGSLENSTDDQWGTATADLSAFAGSTATLRFTFDTVETVARYDEGWYVDDIAVIAEAIPTPDMDAYFIDLSGHVGQPIDIVLASVGEASLSDARLELVDPTGAIAATATSTPLGLPAAGFDLAILDYVVPDVGDNAYTLRIHSEVPGEYGLIVSRSMLLGIEPNQDSQDPLRRIDASSVALGFADIASDPIDSYLVTLPAERPVLMRITTPLNHPQSQPASTLVARFSFDDAPSRTVPTNLAQVSLPDGSVVLTTPITSDIQVGIAAESGLGEYLWEVDVAALDGDFNEDGALDCLDLNALTGALLTGEDRSFDISADGSLDTDDFVLWQVMASQAQFGTGETYQPGDANLDGIVDGLDFEIWSSNRFTMTSGWCNADFNIDGYVDGSDFNIWNDNRFLEMAAASPDRVASMPRAAAIAVAAKQLAPASSLRFDTGRLATEIVFERAALVPDESEILRHKMGRHDSHRISRRLKMIGQDDTRTHEFEQAVQTKLVDHAFSDGWL